MTQNGWGIEDIKIIVHDNGEVTTREATSDIELFDNLTHGRRSQDSAAPRIQKTYTHVTASQKLFLRPYFLQSYSYSRFFFELFIPAVLYEKE